MEIRYLFNIKGLDKYLRNAQKSFDNGSQTTLKDVGELFRARALFIVPRDTGKLAETIITRQGTNTKTFKSVIITTRALDPKVERRLSFQNNSWGTFVNFLHNSDYAGILNWHGKKEDFLLGDYYGDLEQKFEVKMMSIIKTSFKTN